MSNLSRAGFAAGLGCALLLGSPLSASAAEAVSPRVEALLQKMTLDEKIGQLVQRAGGRSKALNSRLDAAELDRVRAGQVGSYLHVAGAEPLAALQKVAVEESRLGIPLLFAMDVVHGYRTIFPVPLAMASTWKPESLELAARIAAVEASSAGLHWTFAPMVDIARDPRWGRIVEGAGEDAYFGSVLAVAQVRGYQGANLSTPDTLMATTKHFGAYGAAIGGRDYNSADLSERTLQEVYMPPFYAAAKAGSASFMSAFNDIGGIPTTANRALARTQLRERWGYQGVLISDWNAIAELLAHGVAEDRSAAGLLALEASLDMDMVGAVYEQDLKRALEASPEHVKFVDEAVLRLLRVKEQLGLFDKPMQYHDVRRESKMLLAPAHREAARTIARESIVLLKNEGSLLPLQPASLKKLAVVGALAGDGLSMLGSWRAQGRAEEVVTILQGLQRAAPKSLAISYAAGADPRTEDLTGIGAALDIVRAADATVLVIGEHFDLSGEARSRADIGVPASQAELARQVFATGKPVIVVLANGRPLAMQWLADAAPAILETWMLGVEAGPAVADVIFGKYSPAGRLPAAFPTSSGAVPFHYGKYPSGRPADPDLSKDTARYMDKPITPTFAFGHGLSYTSFEYSDLAIDNTRIDATGSVTISVTVRNTGKMAGDEVVQLYVRDPIASVARPVQELRGFKRVSLGVGEATRVNFKLAAAQVALFGLDNQWRVEPGRIEVMVGASSTDIRGRTAFEISNGAITSEPAAAIATTVTLSQLKN